MAEASHNSVPVDDSLKSLRTKCESASRFGVNGRYLILQAARKIAAAEQGEHKQQNQAANGSTAAVHHQQQAEAAAVQSPAAALEAAVTAPRAAALVPNQLKPFVAFRARAFTPQHQRQQVVNKLLGSYLVLLMRELQVPPQQQEQVITGSQDIMKAAAAASLAQEASLYKEVTSAQGYNQRSRQLQAAVSFIPGEQVQQMKDKYKPVQQQAAAARTKPAAVASSMRKRQVSSGTDTQLQQQLKRQKADDYNCSKEGGIQRQQQEADMDQLLDDLFEEQYSGEQPADACPPAAAVSARAAECNLAVQQCKQVAVVHSKVKKKKRHHGAGSRAGIESTSQSSSVHIAAAGDAAARLAPGPGQQHQGNAEQKDQQQQPSTQQLEGPGSDDDSVLDLERERQELLASRAARQLAAEQATAAVATAGGARVTGQTAAAAAAIPCCCSPTASPPRLQPFLYSPTRVFEEPADDETLNTAATAAAATREGSQTLVDDLVLGPEAAVGGVATAKQSDGATLPAGHENASDPSSSGSIMSGSDSQGDSQTSSGGQHDDQDEQVDSQAEEIFGADIASCEQLEPAAEIQQQQQDEGDAVTGDGGDSQGASGCTASDGHSMSADQQQACTAAEGKSCEHDGVECRAVEGGEQSVMQQDDAARDAELDLARVAAAKDTLGTVESAVSSEPASGQETQAVTATAGSEATAAALDDKHAGARQSHDHINHQQQNQQQQQEAGDAHVTGAADAIDKRVFQDFEEFARAATDSTRQDGMSVSDEVLPSSSSAAEHKFPLELIPSKVATFVHSVLEPLVKAEVISKVLSVVVCDKAVGKIMKRHKDATDAGFLVKEYSAITRLVTDLVDHYQKQGLV